MLNQKVADLINDQINKELYSAYLYLDFSNYYYDEGLSGYGNWYFIQAQEERDHAMLMLEYLRNNGMPVTLKAIDKPDKEIKSFEDPLKFGLEHDNGIIYERGNAGQRFQGISDGRFAGTGQA